MSSQKNKDGTWKIKRAARRIGKGARGLGKRKGRRILDPDFKNRIDKMLEELKISLYDLHDVATRDEKTGIYNNQFFMNIFEMEIDKAMRGEQKLSIIILDIDFFKKFNDTYGHLVGDEVLSSLAQTIHKELRAYDILARFGGEEFLVLLPGIGQVRANFVAERLRTCLHKNRKLKKYGVTISLGLTEYKKRDNMKRMINRADKALYKSKKEGRNRVSSL